MSEFKVKTQGLRNAAEEEEALHKDLATIYYKVIGHKNNISFKIAATDNIRQRLGNIANGISKEQRILKNMQGRLLDAADLFEKTEKNICDVAKDGKVSFWDKFKTATEVEINPGTKIEMEMDLIDKLHDSNLPDDNYWKKMADKLKDFNERHEKPYKKGYYDPDGNWHDVPDEDAGTEESEKYKEITSLEKAATIASIGVNTSGAVWSLEDEGSKGLAKGSYNVSALKGDFEASAYAGLYSYDADGEKHFTPGIGASIGGGVTAFSASAQGQFGDDYWNAHGNVSVDVGKVGASAEANVGLFDKDGNLNPQLNAGAKIEAILAEASATAGVTVLGTSVDVEGSVNFGIGAHADVGLKDGHLSVDIGASLGVGVGVKFDIDMSGTVNAVTDLVSSAWNGFAGLFK